MKRHLLYLGTTRKENDGRYIRKKEKGSIRKRISIIMSYDTVD